MEGLAFAKIGAWRVCPLERHGRPPGVSETAGWECASLGQEVAYTKAWFCAEAEFPALADAIDAGSADGVYLRVDHRGMGPVFCDGIEKGTVFLHGVLRIADRPGRGTYWLALQIDSYIDRANLQNAQLFVQDRAGVMWKIRDLALSLRSAAMLLSTDTSRQTLYLRKPTGINRSPISDSEREQLHSLLSDAAHAMRPEELTGRSLLEIKALVDSWRESLRPLADFAARFTIYLIGHSHIDLAWKWRWPESIACAEGTFEQQLENMTRHSGFVFVESSPALWEALEDKNPGLFARIRGAAREGRWEPVGGMWCEPDGNLLDGESWSRQLLYGQRYSESKLGRRSTVGWNIDAFGFNANLPKIYKAAGMNAFLTQKLRYNEYNIFPEVCFWWESPDGSRVLGLHVLPDHYQEIDPLDLATAVKDFHLASGLFYAPILFGLGNHGGGPTPDMFERVYECQRLTVFPKVAFSSIENYISAVREREDTSRLPVVRDELYLETHQKTYTTQGKAKRWNRDAEILLTNAEKVASIAALRGENDCRYLLDAAWKKACFNQFHDILPGTSTAAVYQDAREDYRFIRKIGGTVIQRSLGALGARGARGGEAVIVFNPLNWKRTDIVELRLRSGRMEFPRVFDDSGEEVLSQVTSTEPRKLIFLARDVPGLGFRQFRLRMSAAPQPSCRGLLAADKTHLANDFFDLRLDPLSGDVAELTDRAQGWGVIPKGSQGNQLQILEDRPVDFGTWNFGLTGRRWDLGRADGIELLEDGPVRALLRVRKSFFGEWKRKYIKAMVWFTPGRDYPTSFFAQDVILYRGVDRIDFRVHADWWEDYAFLKVAFPVDVEADKATCEIPYGAFERSTRFETPIERARYEVPALRWADLSDGTHGVAVMNRHKHGYDVRGNVMRLSLLAAPTSPNANEVPDPLADRGKHAIHYSLFPHAGNWREGRVSHKGYEFNAPLLPLRASEVDPSFPLGESLVSVGNDELICTALKPAFAGPGLILRFYEPYGQQARASVSCMRRPKKVSRCNLIEDDLDAVDVRSGVAELELKPFEIVTLRLEFE